MNGLSTIFTNNLNHYLKTSCYMHTYYITAIEHNSTKYLHLLIEAMQLSFADTTWYCTDLSKVDVPVDKMLSKDYAAQRRNLIKPDRW